MLRGETKIRVCYADTDKMGVVYYGVYPRFYEVGRTEMIRNLGFSYKALEDTGIILPVRSLNITYFKPAFYDDLLTVRTSIERLPDVKFPIKSEIFNQEGELLNVGEVVLVFCDAITGKPCKVPGRFLQALKDNIG